jgi:hypothetical protein
MKPPVSDTTGASAFGMTTLCPGTGAPDRRVRDTVRHDWGRSFSSVCGQWIGMH